MIVRKWTLFLILGLFIAGAAGCGTMHGKKTTTLNKVPPAAQSVIKTYVGDGNLESIEVGHEEGQHIYEVHYLKGKRRFELEVNEKGDVLEWEKYLEMDELPAAVRATVEKEISGARMTELVQETEEGKMFYEVEFEKDGKEHEVKIAEDGSILEREVE